MPSRRKIPQANGPLLDQVTNEEFWTAITMLAHIVANQGVMAPPNMITPASRVRDFTRMNPPEFHGLKGNKDPQDFVYEVFKITDIMGMFAEEKEKMAAYQLREIDISQLMTYVEQLEGEKLEERRMRESKRARFEDGSSNAKTSEDNGHSQQGQRFQCQGSPRTSGQSFDKYRVSYLKVQGGDMNSSGTTLLTCTKCKRNHGGRYLMGTGACFGCGKMEHKVSKFPNKERKRHPQRQATQGGQAQ
ncbi:uncharacterized protein LOC129869821 [Solanum dulcamara]|uniref:uncharacterized protein LOC129869821 n=1 Tax=Solanum dulcamara TaxID=45834 RepID=UPI002485B849|nr:uncharacterized protein LOC129869821 [Solanum dulcamara]